MSKHEDWQHPLDRKPPPSVADLAMQEELLLKKQKLELEIKHLSRPWFRTHTPWLAIAALVASLIGNVFQYFNQMTELRKARLELENDKLVTKVAALNVEAHRLESYKQVLLVDVEALNEKLLKRTSQVQLTEAKQLEVDARLEASRVALQAMEEKVGKAGCFPFSDVRDTGKGGGDRQIRSLVGRNP